jgi:hypothetical protein
LTLHTLGLDRQQDIKEMAVYNDKFT